MDEIHRQDLLRVVLSSVLVAVPVSLVALGFLSLITVTQEWVWQTLPGDLGYDAPPWWWPVPWLALAGLLVGAVVVTLPGRGGHQPVNGLGGTPTEPSFVPGVALAALAGLPLGVVLGPEAPLIGLGMGVAVWLSRVVRLSPHGRLEALIGTAGAAAAVAVILGSPLTAVVLLAEVVAVAGGPVIAATVVALLGVGVGSLVFTGLGDTAGVKAQSLQLVQLSSVPSPDLADLLWGVPVGVVAAVVMTGLFSGARRIADSVNAMGKGRVVGATVVIGLAVAASASAYAVVTGNNPFDVASSGSETLEELTSDPAAWGTSALVALLVFKGLGYALSLSVFRGGPIFPAIMLGGAFGVLIQGLPGLGLAGGLAIGIGAFAAAAMRLPLSAFALTMLLFGTNASQVVPEVAIAVVTAFAARVALDKRSATSGGAAATAAAS
jgi:H+/Cl- antiporter ClcA